MSEEGRVIVRSPSLNPMKIAGSPHWRPRDSRLSLTRTPRDCGSSTAPNMEKFPERPAARALAREALQAASGTPSDPPPEPSRTQTFFQIFYRAASRRRFSGPLISCNHWIIFDDPLCDDLLTIGVDSPEGGAYNPNH